MAAHERLCVEITGAVQGVGFRPYVYRLARELALAGWIVNDTRGVRIEAEGPRVRLERFLARLPAEKPPRGVIHGLAASWHAATGGPPGFEIRASDGRGAKTAAVLPDVATCEDCLAEVLAPDDRRHRYPFTNCTNCGPRFSIVEALPYDRPHTTMRGFVMCPRCRREYEEPLDRRFHAQPNACPACGPRLALWDRAGRERARGDAALRLAARALAAGEVVAMKGLGGFHLMADAGAAAPVQRLRDGKPRREKPFALMVADLAQAARLCALPEGARELLSAPEAPIVLLPRRADAPVAANVAPDTPDLGLMLPCTPLHHLLLREAGRPLVATSGNLSEEPICTDEREAVRRLGALADRFLVHDRPIARHVDDSVAWLAHGAPRLLRRARGYAPAPVRVRGALPPILAVGAHLKSTVALGLGRSVFLSQHIGDLETPQALEAFQRVIADFLRLYDAEPAVVAHDLHPDYLSTAWARDAGFPCVGVQHHHAHLAACLADNGVDGPALGVTWDGTGYGPDGTVWGGEFLLGDARGCARVAHLRPFRLPGGDAAAREPRRSALALLQETFGDDYPPDLPPVAACTAAERAVFTRMAARGLHAPWTTSAGRLFDGFAALLGLAQRTTFEGQAARALEHAADPGTRGAYPLGADLDWRPAVAGAVADLRRGVDPGVIAARFHNALVEAIVAVARSVGERRVALAGGCFQNRRLTEGAARALRRAGFEVLLHRQVPPHDGGLSLGQVMVAAARREGSCT